MSNAELIFAVFDATREISEDDISLIESLKAHRAERVAILNKCDGERKFDASILHESFDNVIEISALGLVGRDEICSVLEALFIDGRLNIGEDALITNARQNAALTNAKEAISRAIDSIRCKMPLDACCIDIEEAMQYIGEHLGSPLSLEEIAGQLFVSKYHLSHAFSAEVGVSVYRYILLRRLLMARQLLTAGEPAGQVCRSCGFSDYTSFYRAFKSEYGISPREFAAS